MLYDRPGEGWTDLPEVVGPGVPLTMAVEVQTTLYHTVSPGDVEVTRYEPGMPPVVMPASGPVSLSGGRLVFPLGEWTPAIVGEVTFDVRLTINDQHENGDNNHRVFTVQVGLCIPPVDLP
jgi:hypothetical protein